MKRSAQRRLDDARCIWQAGVEAVRSERLIPQHVRVEGEILWIAGEPIELARVGRIAVVGMGKAGAGMTLALERTLGNSLLKSKRVEGCVSVPEDCVCPTEAISLVAGRPAGLNEPTGKGVEASRRIMQLVRSLGPSDLCLVLISGGGSALLPAPVGGITLEEKVALTRLLSGSGATIDQMNLVRRHLSQVKGGGLAAACRAGRLIALILSDVPGDHLETIASGPTVACQADPAGALQVLGELGLVKLPEIGPVVDLLIKGQRHPVRPPARMSHVTNRVIGNNAAAVAAAGAEAERRGYRHAMISSTECEGLVEGVASQLVRTARSMRDSITTRGNALGKAGPDCLISGGEPTVQLVDQAHRGKGGRNQQLVLSALAGRDDWQGVTLLSGGTDGEDGPTDAAGAWVDEGLAQRARQQGLDPTEYLRRNDAYHFFEPLGGLLKTGPTHTNVCDLRVVVVE